MHRQVALGDVQIGAAHTASAHGDKEFAGSGLRHVDGDAFQRPAVNGAWPQDPPRVHRLGCHQPIVTPNGDGRRIRPSPNALKAGV
jgi:hypothetical protein